MSVPLRLVCCVLLGYLLGSVNGAILISQLKTHEDVRSKGSGNAGLTNFFRTCGGWATLLVILIDVGKAVLAGLLAGLLLPSDVTLGKMVAGFAVQVGHIFPIFFGFRGGKGVLCSAAVAAMLDWRIFAIAFPLFLIVVALTRLVSLGSVVAIITYAILFVVFFRRRPEIWLLAVAMSLLAIFMHRGNIVRLLHGVEPKLGASKK